MSQSIHGENLKEQNSELFFVEVKDHGEIRKNILETLKDILEVLQRFEKFKHIRHEKLEKINRLRTLLKDANKILGLLKGKLPQTNLRATVVKETPKAHSKAHHKKNKKSKQPEEKVSKKEKTELEKLETELNAIEDKLRNLN